VILALAETPTTWRYGYELCRQLDLMPGSIYPILIRLTDRPATSRRRRPGPSGPGCTSPSGRHWPPALSPTRLGCRRPRRCTTPPGYP